MYDMCITLETFKKDSLTSKPRGNLISYNWNKHLKYDVTSHTLDAMHRCSSCVSAHQGPQNWGLPSGCWQQDPRFWSSPQRKPLQWSRARFFTQEGGEAEFAAADAPTKCLCCALFYNVDHMPFLFFLILVFFFFRNETRASVRWRNSKKVAPSSMLYRVP